MPISFRTYNDPGVYIESITPPVVFTSAIEPTIVAIVGEAPTSRDAVDSANLTTGVWYDLSILGGDPSTVNVTDRLLGTQYVSAGVATLDTLVGTGTGSWTVSTFDDALLPSTPFNIQIEDEEVTISAASTGTGVSWTVSARAQNATVAVAHGAGQVLNLLELYSTTPSLEVASIDTPISATATQFTATEGYGVQVITLGGFAGADEFTLSYGGQTTASLGVTPVTAAEVEAALELLSTITNVAVTGANDGPFTVKFLDPNTDITAITGVQVVGTVTVTVTNQGITDETFLDVEGERMHVTAVSGSAPQTVTVVRGVGGTTADSHGAVDVYENSGADYLVKVGVGEDELLGTDDDDLSLKILDSARISNGSFVNVALQATDSSQFDATLFTDMDEIREKYGDPLDASGSVNSPLTLAAQIALANGATQLVLVGTDANNTVQEGIDKLEFRQDVNSVVILSGSVAGAGSNDINYLKGHVEQMSDNGVLRRAFVGIDGVLTAAPTYSDYVSKAAVLNSERVSLVAPSRIKLDNGTGTPILVGGQYAAAAVAGLQAGQVPQEPLTRKQVFGFVGIDDQDSTNNVFRMQAGGVLVVFEDRLGRLIIKHGLTTDMTSVYTREISVITARDRLRDFVLETLEGGALIGSPMTNETPNLVLAAVNSALEEAMLQGLIFDYGEVKFRFPTENPTLIQVRFAYKPTLPLNYIHVQFNIDTDTGTIEFQSINDNTSQPTT